MIEDLASTSSAQSDPGERRQVSVLFADIAGYTAISAELGEEKTLDFVRKAYGILSQTIDRYGGSTRDFAGDGIMALFGVREALENGALRACRAALEINEAFAEAANDFEARFGVRPSVRVGVSSGTALVAAVAGEGSPATAFGSTVNLASRIESLAPPGGCLICDATRRLVEWLADVSFAGEHAIKGFSKPRKLWTLQAIRKNATRFDASLAQGLSGYVGRMAELRRLSAALARANDDLALVDLVGEPGLGKTRLVFEFLQHVPEDEATVVAGQCSADGQQVPFLPILEMVRTSFNIRDGDDPSEVARKLEKGLARSDLDTEENLALLLNLLGQNPQNAALDGLDGVLIGLRTRALLPKLLQKRCEQEKMILVLEDAHWIDSATEGLLNALVEAGEPSNLMIILTRRPEYKPKWLKQPAVETITLAPLAAEDIEHLALGRLSINTLPEALSRQLTERAGGNPLFGEEILSFLLDQGALRIDGGEASFDADRGEHALPASMLDLLAARTERLDPQDRELLQAASVIGRRFDPGLLSQVVGRPDDIGAGLQRLQALDILFREANSSDYIFKHVLLRDSVYQSLVTARRAVLHLATAHALEIRNSNLLEEVAETLAHHFGHTDRTDGAFTYNAMAGAKSLGTYSLDEANRYFVSALELYRDDPSCATDVQFAALVADFALCSNISLRVTDFIERVENIRPILDSMGDSRNHVLFLHHYVSCLVCNGKYLEAYRVQQDLTAMADRLGDPESKAYAMVNELSVSIYHAPISNAVFEAKTNEIESVLDTFEDAYIQNFHLATVGWNELTRGRVNGANATADKMIEIGTSRNDPRSLGYGTAMKALIAMVTDDHATALKMAEDARAASRVEFELAIAEAARVSSLVPLEMAGALETVERHIDEYGARGLGLFTAGPETMLGVAYAMNGQITRGLEQIEGAVNRRDAEGSRTAADWARLFLCEMYLAILSGEGGASPVVLLRNIGAIARVMFSGQKRLISMIDQVRQNPQFDEDGHYIARCDMMMGLLYKAKKKNALAKKHLTLARQTVASAGQSPMLARIEAALADLAA